MSPPPGRSLPALLNPTRIMLLTKAEHFSSVISRPLPQWSRYPTYSLSCKWVMWRSKSSIARKERSATHLLASAVLSVAKWLSTNMMATKPYSLMVQLYALVGQRGTAAYMFQTSMKTQPRKTSSISSQSKHLDNLVLICIFKLMLTWHTSADQ